MPQDTRLVTCDQSSKAIHYKSKFITPRKQAVRNQVDRTDSSQKDQVPRISPIEQFPRSETNFKVQKRKLFQLWRDTVASQKYVSTKEGASGVWRKGIAVVCRSKSKDACVNELQLQSATVPECMDPVLDEYEPVYFNALNRHLKTVTVERTLTETEQCYSNIERELLRVCYWKISSLCLWIHSASINRSQAIGQHVEEIQCVTHRAFRGYCWDYPNLWCEHWIPERKG